VCPRGGLKPLIELPVRLRERIRAGRERIVGEEIPVSKYPSDFERIVGKNISRRVRSLHDEQSAVLEQTGSLDRWCVTLEQKIIGGDEVFKACSVAWPQHEPGQRQECRLRAPGFERGRQPIQDPAGRMEAADMYRLRRKP